MRTEVTDIPRRTWAPFVGAALAALTAGSLVVFSLVAQKTSLDGFPDRRVIATGSAQDPTPSSITIAPVESAGSAEGGTSIADGPAPSTPSATALLEIAPPSVTVAALDGLSSEPVAPDADRAAGDTTPARAPAPTGSFRAEEPLLLRHGGGDVNERDAWDSRHDGRHTHKSHQAKDRNRADKANRASKRSKEHKKSKSAPKGPRGKSQDRPRDNSRGAVQNRNVGSRPAPAPARSARPAARSSNEASRSRSSSGSPPAHSNAGGNGKSRGRGHGKR